jgi:hypothetical protein
MDVKLFVFKREREKTEMRGTFCFSTISFSFDTFAHNLKSCIKVQAKR